MKLPLVPADPALLVEGRTLQEHLDEGSTFPEQAAMQIVLEVSEVLKWAAPTAHADNVPIGLGDQIIGEMGADHAGDTCDQGAGLRHAERTPLSARNASIAPRIWSRAA